MISTYSFLEIFICRTTSKTAIFYARVFFTANTSHFSFFAVDFFFPPLWYYHFYYMMSAENQLKKIKPWMAVTLLVIYAQLNLWQ